MNKGKILVTPRSLSKTGHPALEALETAGFEVLTPFPGKMPSREELLDILPECTGYLAGVEKIDAELLEHCVKLKVISRNGVGVENIDPDAAGKMGIEIKTTPGANARGVAELAAGLMFALARSIPEINYSIKNGRWERQKGFELSGRKLGVVGTGMIGKQVISIALGIGMEVLAYDLYPDKVLGTLDSVKYCSLEELLEKSDIVTLHCPAGEKPVIDRSALEHMKKGGYLINTARASLVDDKAVLSALESGSLAGYAVDAFDTEPPQLTDLLRHQNVITTAHIGGFTKESVDRATEAAVKNLLSVLEPV